jgi:hypothetical protein
MSKDTGGPAFPEPLAVSPMGDLYNAAPGMTLRDYFAAKALSGLFASMSDDFVRQQFIDKSMRDHTTAKQQVARCAYEYADEMLAERAK